MSTSNSLTDLQSALKAAQIRLKGAVQALAPKHKGGELEEFAAAHEALLEAERALAAAQNEPHAVPIEFPVQWDTGARFPICSRTTIGRFWCSSCATLIQTGMEPTSTFVTLIILVQATLQLSSSSVAYAQRWGHQMTRCFMAIR